MSIPHRRFTARHAFFVVSGVSILAGVTVAWCMGARLELGGLVGLVTPFAWLKAHADASSVASRLENDAAIALRFRVLDPDGPYVANRKVGLRGFFDLSREVIALYPEQLIVVNVKNSLDPWWSVFDEDSADTLRALPRYGKARTFPLSEVESLHVHRAQVFSPSLTFTGRTERTTFRFTLPGEEGAVFLQAFERQLPGCVRVTADTLAGTRRKRLRKMGAICLILDTAAVFLVWFAPGDGIHIAGLELVATVRNRLGPWASAGVLAYLIVFFNALLMFIASRPDGKEVSTKALEGHVDE